MAPSATELFDDRLSGLWRTGDLGMIIRSMLSSGTPGEHSNNGCDKGYDPQVPAHKKIGCDMVSQPFSRNLLIVDNVLGFRGVCRSGIDRIQFNMKCKEPRRRFSGYARSSLGLVFVMVVAVPACFCQQGSASPSPDGKQIFEQHCAECHGSRGEGISAAITYAGPSLQAEHNPGKVMAAVEYGPEHMPRFEYVLSVEQIRAVANYVTQNLAVIPLSGGNLTDGGELFRTYCATCHRTAVRGGALGFVGINAPSLVEKSPEIIAGAIRWGPGPMPKFPSSVLSDEQVASIVQYIQNVQHPPNPGGDPMRWYGPTSEGFAAWVILLVAILFTMWVERGGQG
jgi:ubiquinol-cytochrome c reductase cytochrome c subunit